MLTIFLFKLPCSKCQRLLADKNARDVHGLPFQGGAGSWLFTLQLLWLQRYPLLPSLLRCAASILHGMLSFSVVLNKRNENSIYSCTQEPLECGEHKRLSSPVVGRNELLLRTWTWHFEQASWVGNSFTMAA